MILFSFNRVNSTIITIIKRLIQTQRYMYIHIGMLMFSFFLNDENNNEKSKTKRSFLKTIFFNSLFKNGCF